ncbi:MULTISPECIES: phosphopentomutase [Thermoanaerobacter]|uniref:Phosphopentomutase n=2 Tax=Thermoanaerobacter TaxID=1754 RepID=I8R196_9THEO|nr:MULTISPECIES: phosphopentomutase [Thermoanaerobacter]EIV99129.1 phosphopentomutase [Thermoanaerobacter siderophilus SR4]EMT38298.1 phosphopentomutase [Thermoanaerobacter thermohydrosulfuricus WC1]UZQ83453.1 phosphopentomutase [Thermoanaerobacter sp. RKWS2]
MFKRVILIVLDSVGVGELPDAYKFGDEGSNTLGHVTEKTGIGLPNMGKLGLGNIIPLKSVPENPNAVGGYGKMAEKSAGKDTTTGHWEIAGLITEKPFPTYPHGFPEEIIKEFEKRIGRKVLGNKPASGTEIIKELGEEHVKTGYPIVYTSADSVFQVAAHEDVIPLEELYRICEIAREILKGDHAVGRVIARPFTGTPGNFVRTGNRRDFSLKPFEPTILDMLKEAGYEVFAIGKIEDIFAGQGITEKNHTTNNDEGITATIKAMDEIKNGLIFTNLVDFDMLYGHRNDVEGYAKALTHFDNRLPEIMGKLTKEDLLIITADHGCDPTTPSTDHSREYVPLLVYSPSMKHGVNLGVRSTYSDVAATIAEIFKVGPTKHGTSFLKELPL